MFTTADPSGFAQQHQIHASCVQTVPNLNPSRLYIVHSLLEPPITINSARDSSLYGSLTSQLNAHGSKPSLRSFPV